MNKIYVTWWGSPLTKHDWLIYDRPNTRENLDNLITDVIAAGLSIAITPHGEDVRVFIDWAKNPFRQR